MIQWLKNLWNAQASARALKIIEPIAANRQQHIERLTSQVDKLNQSLRAAEQTLSEIRLDVEENNLRMQAVEQDFNESEKNRTVLIQRVAELKRLLDTERTTRAQAEAKLALAQHYLSDLPAPTPDDIEWEDDDTKTLATFLETSATGKKLAQHLANRLADYERAAVLYRSPADMPALLKRAHGFRDCRGEILRLSAAGPMPANHEQPDFPLPTDLENLRG